MVEISTSVTDPNAVKSTTITLIKRAKANEPVPNHQEVFMARAENLAGLGCMPYL
jgi:hypothetical protein